MSRLQRIKDYIKENFEIGNCGIFYTHNKVGDTIDLVYKYDNVSVYLCKDWKYYEVFGLTKKEQFELSEYYIQLKLHSFF